MQYALSILNYASSKTWAKLIKATDQEPYEKIWILITAIFFHVQGLLVTSPYKKTGFKLLGATHNNAFLVIMLPIWLDSMQ